MVLVIPPSKEALALTALAMTKMDKITKCIKTEKT
jgi:hypothetical protein